MGVHGSEARTSIHSSDGQAKAAAGFVFWLAVSAGATGGAFQLNDSTDDSGTDKISLSMPENSVAHFPFDPPIEFKNGIYVDVEGTNLLINVGYN